MRLKSFIICCLIFSLTLMVSAQSDIKPGEIVPSQVNTLTVSPDGNYIVTGHRGGISYWEGDTGKLIAQFPLQLNDVTTQSAPNVGQIAWNPDGTQLAVRLSSAESIFIQILSVPNSDVLYQYVIEAQSTHLTWHPDGTKLAYLHFQDLNGPIDLKIMDVPTGEVLHTIPVQEQGHVGNLTWSPDGSKFALAYVLFNEPGITIYDAKTYQQLTTLPHQWNVNGVSWRFDSQQILTSGYYPDDLTDTDQAVLTIWDAITGQVIRQFSNLPKFSDAKWHPFEDIVALDLVLSGIALIDPNSGAVLHQSTESGRFPLWKPDGSQIVVIAGSAPAFYTRDGHYISPYPMIIRHGLVERDLTEYQDPLLKGIDQDTVIELLTYADARELGIRVFVSGDSTQSVRVDFGDEQFILNDAPFIFPLPDLGTYTTITSTPYTERDGQGIEGIPLTITFKIIEGAPIENLSPIAHAGEDQTVSAYSDGTVLFKLDGSASSDPDGQIVSYRWTLDDVEIATAVTWSVFLEVGVHEIILTVTDDDGAIATDTITVTVGEYIPSCDVTARNPQELIDAITQANNNGTLEDVICLEATTYTFSTAENRIALPDITSTIMIIGHGAILERSPDAPNFRIFYVRRDAELTLNDLTIQNGKVDGNGGALITFGGSIALDGVTLINNTAGYGGAIHSTGNLTITDSVLINNRATENGGVIYSDGTLSVDDTMFEGNNARYGSGIYIVNGTANIHNITIQMNNNSEEGAGIYNNTGVLTITGIQIIDNHAEESAGTIDNSGGDG